MKTIIMGYNGSIETKQNRIKLTERLLNSYGDNLVFLQTAHPISSYQQRMPSHSNVFQVLLVFQEFAVKKAALIPEELGLKCIEDATPFPWPIKSLDLREKQYLKLRSLSLKDYCLLNKATMVS